ncbi:Zn(2)-C6 fungal-type DNA-binding domain protein [Niveomyces insectorum RCEF 264]|uniref:Zn(2)-C6 fungal-type DNA-binding domain protein n=1 Tax=Niveomyces insectorum RCEF 264 TaxID=1081102 RepID=A0A167ZBT4_9HYPO|nr:Zn(2)-C6 fungal-type DNA-binding domain protein [Niveomyces insectorum RCEF 264]
MSVATGGELPSGDDAVLASSSTATTSVTGITGSTATAAKPYIGKRPHKKSRAGCHNCKVRKVKCSETRPRCRACTLRNEACVYPSAVSSRAAGAGAGAGAGTGTSNSNSSSRSATVSSAPPVALRFKHTTSATLALPSSASTSSSPPEWPAVHDNARSRGASPLLVASSSSSSPSSPSSCPGTSVVRASQARPAWGGDDDGGLRLLEEPLFLPPQVDETDIKLFWFYTTKGFDSFAAGAGNQPKVDEIMQVIIPRHAFERRFLMDCLLALSALELQRLNQPIDAARTLMYRARAYAGYRSAIEEARPETFPALLACSLLLCALSSETFRDPDSRPLYILDWMIVWRGIGLIVRIIRPEKFHESGMAMLFARPPINLDASARHTPNHLLFMVSAIRPDDPDFAQVGVYYETLKYLGSLYRELESGFGRMLQLRVITWFTFVPEAFITLARQCRPRALVIVAHYLAFVKLCKRVWWMAGIADKQIGDIRNALDDEWHPYLSAPLAVLKTDDSIALGRILLNDEQWMPDANYETARKLRPKSLSLVDDKGHDVVFDGKWARARSGDAPEWNARSIPRQPPSSDEPTSDDALDDILEPCQPWLEIPFTSPPSSNNSP